MSEITARLSTALADRYAIERGAGLGGLAAVLLLAMVTPDVRAQDFRGAYFVGRLSSKPRGVANEAMGLL